MYLFIYCLVYLFQDVFDRHIYLFMYLFVYLILAIMAKKTKPKHHVSATLICFAFLFKKHNNKTKKLFTSIPSTTRAGFMTYGEAKSPLPGNCVCIDCGFRSREAMGGERRRRRREVRGCGEDSRGLATCVCGWASALVGWLMENFMLYSPVLPWFL